MGEILAALLVERDPAPAPPPPPAE